MNESTRTLSYIGAAAVSMVLAAFLAPSTPKAPDDFSQVGQAFYSDFAATDATSLTVVSFNEDTRAKVFNVELKKGKWVIGSHHDYPADGKDRLAKTAASVIGIKKEQFATKDPDQYASMQVVDPLDEDEKKLKGRGQRITLKDASGKVLVDYIVGKKVPNRDSYYYVRNPNEKSVYMAKLNIDLSTKFADWIESDLLKLQGENLNEIVINKYSIDKTKGRLTGQETNVLKRDKPADPWTLKDLKADTEEVNQDEVRTLTTALTDLKIIGVREKPAGLSADLKTEAGIKLDAIAQSSLHSKGFYFTNDGQLLSNEGEILPITDGGVAYTLRFGEVLVGSELETETGIEAEKRKQDAKDGKKEEEKGSTKSRYVFITAHFDQDAIGPKPVSPEEAAAKAAAPPAAKPEDTQKPEATPEKKEETKPDADKPAAEDKKPEQPPAEKPAEDKAKPDTPPSTEKPAEDKPAEGKPEAKADETPKSGNCQEGDKKADEPAADAKAETKAEDKPAAPAAPPAVPATPPAAQKAAPAPGAPAAAPKGPTPEEAAKAAALEAKKKYEADLKAYEDKVKKGQEKVKELNDRFAAWYYVISEENFLKLRLSRASLVKPKTKPEPKPGEAKPGQTPPGAAQPEESQPEESQPEAKKPEEKKPDEAKPAETKAEPKSEPKAEDKKPEETKSEDKKPEETKSEDKKPE